MNIKPIVLTRILPLISVLMAMLAALSADLSGLQFAIVLGLAAIILLLVLVKSGTTHQDAQIRPEESTEKEDELIGLQRDKIVALEKELEAVKNDNITRQKNLTYADHVLTNGTRAAYLLDEDGLIEAANHEFEELTGYTLHEIQGSRPKDILAGPDTSHKDLDQLKRGMERRDSFSQQVLNYKQDGSSFTALITGEPVLSKPGGSQKHLLFIQDISQYIQAESERKILNKLANAINDAVIIMDNNGAIEWVNRAFERISEYSSDEVIGRKAKTLLRDKNIPAKNGADDYTLIEGTVYNQTKTGQGYWSSRSVTPIYDAQGEVEKFIAIESKIDVENDRVKEIEKQIHEIWEDQYARSEELEKREQELVEALELCNKIQKDVEELWQLSEQLDSAVIITDRFGKVEWVNEGFEQVFDTKFSEIAGKKPNFSKTGVSKD